MLKSSEFLVAITCGVLHHLAWSFKAGIYSILCGWLAVLFTVLLVRAKSRPMLSAYLAGIVTYSLGFSFLYQTIHAFGGFPNWITLILMAAFVAVSGLQFIIYSALYRLAPKSLLSPALSWIVAEAFSIRIFPWEPAHTQIGFDVLTQLAALGGTQLITLTMFLGAELLLRAPKLSSSGSLGFLALLSCGLWQCTQTAKILSEDNGEPLKVGVVQANVQLSEAHDITMYTVNRSRYSELSEQIALPGMLIVWPEAVNTEFIWDGISSVSETDKLPSAPKETSLLFGGLTYDHANRVYNSSITITERGEVLAPYHKQILMPFGEYMPFSSIFPALNSLLPGGSGFSAGSSVAVLKLSHANFSPLICYEDLLPSLASQAALGGAEVLINQSNDIWFGDGLANYQHHRIASFRAIETGRFLVRSTNTGFSGVIDPWGDTTASIKPFTDGTLVADLALIKKNTIFTRLRGWELWRWFSWVWFLLALWKIVQKR